MSLKEKLSKRGLFLIFEGPDGCGKTTISKLVNGLLNQWGYPSTYISNPGGTPVGDQIRNIVKSNKINDVEVQTWLFLTSIRDAFINIALPKLANKEIVIMDRFLRSSWIYQHLYAPLDNETDKQYNARLSLYKDMVDNHILIDHFIPDHEFILTCPSSVLLSRIHNRDIENTIKDENNITDVFEENDSFISNINDLYYDSIINPPYISRGNIQSLDGQLDPYVIANDIIWGLDGRPERRGTVFKELN